MPFLRILRNISTRFSIVKLSVTPVYYPEYCGLTAGEPALGCIEQIYFPYLSTNNRKFKWRHVKDVYCLHLWKKINTEWYTV